MKLYTLEEEMTNTIDEMIDEIKEKEHQYDFVIELIDNTVPIYYADSLEVAIDNLYFATETPDGSEEATPVEMINMNIYEHLNEIAFKHLKDKYKMDL